MSCNELEGGKGNRKRRYAFIHSTNKYFFKNLVCVRHHAGTESLALMVEKRNDLPSVSHMEIERSVLS